MSPNEGGVKSPDMNLIQKRWAVVCGATHPQGQRGTLRTPGPAALGLLAAWVLLGGAPRGLALDPLACCNAVQSGNGFIRFPLGTIGAWSTASGDYADVLTRAPRVYPCLNAITLKGEKEDWRASVTGDPSLLVIRYKTNQPAGGSTMALTVAPHVTVLQVSFPEGSSKRHLIFDFRGGAVDSWARLAKWTDRTVTQVDRTTLHATVREPGQPGAHYVIKFSVPGVSVGTVDVAGGIVPGAAHVTGPKPGMYVEFDAPEVTVAIATSFTSLDRAGEFLTAESDGFEAVHQRCRTAWSEVLRRVELEGSPSSQRMAYTALYTIWANILDGGDGSHYAGGGSRPRSVASSAYWQFIGGYQSCCWDNVRATYPFLSLAYPEVMADVIGNYLERYQRDGCMEGDICLFTGPSGHNNIRFSPVMIAQALQSGVPADYTRLYAALNDNFHNPRLVSASLWPLGRLTQPATGGFACSRTLEYATGAQAMGLLARIHHDSEGAKQYLGLSQAYTNLWDSTNQAFRLRNADGTWGPVDNAKMTWNPNPPGLFEGTTQDWRFAIPHDPYGLIRLPGQAGFPGRLLDYCLNDAWFNDYQCIYPYMLYYADAPNVAQQLIRNTWVPLFESGVMYEGIRPKPPHNGWQDHYTGNAGWLLCSMLGLYPAAAPPGQFIISSPSLSRAVLHHGKADLTIETRNHSRSNIYLRALTVDGKPYPCYMIPARRLAAGARLGLDLTDDPSAGLGDLYIGSSDGFILKADLVSDTRLKFTVEAAVVDATTRIHSRTQPAQVLVNGQESKDWDYDATKQVLAMPTTGTATVEIGLR